MKKLKNKGFFFAFLLPFSVWCVCLALNGIVPFGTGTLLISDMNSQYIDFLGAYQRVLKSGSGWFYSWEAGMGMSFPAMVAYYLASPFNLLLLFFPDNALPLAVSVITGLKLGCAGLSFFAFLRYRFGENDLKGCLFGLFYALSGYTLGYIFNIMWLDAVILLPLLALETERLLREGDWGRLTVCFALSFLTQFYMSWMTGFFTALYLLLRLFTVYRKEWWKSVIRFGLSVGIAAGLSAFPLLPTYLVLKNNMGLIGQEIPGWETQFPLWKILLKSYAGTFDGMKDCLPHIYAGLPAIIGTAAYFLNRKISRKERIGAAFLLGFLLISFWLRPLDFFWHALDDPSWFPFRYAYLAGFFLLTCAYEGLEAPKPVPWICLALAALLALYRAEWLILCVNLALLAVYAALSLSRGGSQKIILCAACIAEVLFSAQMVFLAYDAKSADLRDYESFRQTYAPRLTELRPAGDSFYRIEKPDYRTHNDPMGLGFPGISHFSSTANTRQSEFLKRFGFDCYATWCVYHGGTDFSDAFLDIRYVLKEDPSEEPLPNETTFPLFFFASEDFARLDYYSDDLNPVKRQDAMLRLLSMEESAFFRSVPVKKTGELTWLVPADADCLYVSEISLNYDVWLNGEQVYSAGASYTPYVIDLRNMDEVEVKVGLGNQPRFKGKVRAFALDDARFAALSGKINQNAPEIHRTSNSAFSLKLRPSDEERLLISSISFDSGWKIKADGKPISPRMIFNNLLAVNVPAGCESLEISYTPYGAKEGCLISLGALFFFIGMTLLERKKIFIL